MIDSVCESQMAARATPQQRYFCAYPSGPDATKLAASGRNFHHPVPAIRLGLV